MRAQHKLCVGVFALVAALSWPARSSLPTATWSTWDTTLTVSTSAAQQQRADRASWVWLLRDSDVSHNSSGPVGIGDINGDMIDDFLVNVSWGSSNYVLSGVTILLGTTADTLGLENPLDPFNTDLSTVLVRGVSFICSCDLDGDGISDLVLQTLGGLALLAGHRGEWPASMDSRSLTTALWNGEVSKVRSVGDINGDRIHDIAFRTDNCITVVFGSPNLFFPAQHNIDGSNGFVVNISVAQGSATDDVVGVGDVDGDKYDDIGVVIKVGANINKMPYVVLVKGRAVWRQTVNIWPLESSNSEAIWLVKESLPVQAHFTQQRVQGFDLDKDNRADVLLNILYKYPSVRDTVQFGSNLIELQNQLYTQPLICGGGSVSGTWTVGDVDGDRAPDVVDHVSHSDGCQWTVYRTSRVAELYQRCPVPGYDLAKVEIIYSPHLEQAFENRVAQLQARISNKSFAPGYERESNRALRTAVRDRLMDMVRKNPEAAFPNVKLVPMWHGTRAEALESVFRAGYANLATTDEGFFGKGVYSTYEARYASEVYSRGALLVNWVSFFSAYPVVDGDMEKLVGKGSYSNYDAHFIP
eukprot:m51a1_g11555 hypothetical protein (584) ;mRNA; r:4175-16007